MQSDCLAGVHTTIGIDSSNNAVIIIQLIIDQFEITKCHKNYL